MRTEIERPNSSRRLSAWTATPTLVARCQSVRERSPSPITRLNLAPGPARFDAMLLDQSLARTAELFSWPGSYNVCHRATSTNSIAKEVATLLLPSRSCDPTKHIGEWRANAGPA